MIRFIFITILLVNFLYSKTITVAVAANVSYAMPVLIKAFNKKYPNIKVKTILGGSGKLTAQINNNAPFDIFLSANMVYPNSLYKSGLAITKPIIYAQGSLAIFSKHKRDFSLGLDILKDKKIKKIAIANPKLAPYGKASIQALKNKKLYKKIKNKFVYGQSISQTVSYAIIACDIGFVAKSSLYSPSMLKYKKGINWEDVNPKLYTPIDQGIVILKYGKNKPEVKTFYNFILSKQSKEIFKQFGYK